MCSWECGPGPPNKAVRLQRSISSTPHHPQIPPANRPGYRPTAAPTTSEKDSFLDATDPLTLLPNKLKTFLFHNIIYNIPSRDRGNHTVTKMVGVSPFLQGIQGVTPKN